MRLGEEKCFFWWKRLGEEVSPGLGGNLTLNEFGICFFTAPIFGSFPLGGCHRAILPQMSCVAHEHQLDVPCTCLKVSSDGR